MDSKGGHETPTFVTTIVENMITNSPDVAIPVLEDLRENPNPTTEDLKQLEATRTGTYVEMHSFIGKVIADRKLFPDIDLSDETINEANSEEMQQEVLAIISRRKREAGIGLGGISEIEASQITRANYLLAMAKIALRRSTANQERAGA